MQVTATMAGTVLHVLVSEGDRVETGQDVVMLESMKMEVPVSSEHSGVVSKILVDPGAFVNEGEPLIDLG